MNKDTVKTVVAIVTNLGVGAIVQQSVKNNVTPTGPITMITIPVATFFIGGFVAMRVTNHSDDVVDDVYKAFNQMRDSRAS